MPYELILAEIRGRVGLITLNRPQAMNALNNRLMGELMDALEDCDQNESVGAMVITRGDGSGNQLIGVSGNVANQQVELGNGDAQQGVGHGHGVGSGQEVP